MSDIESWLKANKLKKYISSFLDEEIDLDDLKKWDKKKLTKFVIKPFGMNELHQERLLDGIKALKPQKKKKKKKKKDDNSNTNDGNNDTNNGNNKLVTNNNYFDQNDNRDYPYTVLLDRIFGLLKKQNPEISNKTILSLPPPKMGFVGSRKTGWSNFKETCDKLDRNPKHAQSFFLAEMNTDGNADGDGNLILKGRWRPKQVQSLLKKYIREYVTCKNCKSTKTNLEKDNATRLYFLKCRMCGAERSVAPIQRGFHATMRGDRRAARARQ
mmetsp:Transcript_77744/g.95241  ORF Transcript_77744/g.95241 Transcript_77744/m.95241 type:complete len:270 (+) Transcript_77744:44-853(+)